MTSAADVVVIGAGQSGLAAARALQARGISPVVLEAGDRAAGSWPCYYDSLKAFSPAGFNSMPGLAFPGDPDRYPARDEVAGYLERYAAALGAEIHTHTRVAAVGKHGRDFVVVTADGRRLRAAGVVAATGSFSAPYRPGLPRSGELHRRIHPCRRLPQPGPLRREAGRRGRCG
jgi:putative flavoprotein involved in K+ transport